MPKDPYRYFRIEAQELLEGLTQGLLALDKGPNRELMQRVLRFAHTFKGASRVVKRPDIGDLAHQIEDLLAPHRDRDQPLEDDVISRALSYVDQMRGLVGALGAEAAPVRDQTLPAWPEPDEQAVRIAVSELDGLLAGVVESHAAVGSLRREIARVGQARDRARRLLSQPGDARRPGQPARWLEDLAWLTDALELAQRRMLEGVDRAQAELTELRSLVSELRLVPAYVLTSVIEQAVRDAASTLHKQVEVVCTGAQTHMDAHVLAGLRPALVHLVRNSVAHGIEPAAERQRAGKPATGRIEVRLERRGQRILVSCRDDGGGIDVERVRQTAVERGVLAPQAAETTGDAALASLLLRGGLSTSRTVDDVAGRGVGLDAVRDIVEQLKGEVSLRSVRGRETTVEIQVPVSLSGLLTLAMQIDESTVLLPLDGVRLTQRLSSSDIARSVGGEQVLLNGEPIPFLPLRRALKRPAAPSEARCSVVVVEAEGRLAAVGVDRLGGVRNVVLQNIPEHAGADPVVLGAALDVEGVPQLVLGARALVRLAWETRTAVNDPIAPRPLPLLVVDDSLTTRMLEQSILESAGYEVDLAVSAEDALEKARRRRYGLFVVDVEMPGMDGFGFVAATRSDPALRDTPSILVTSRADPEDKRRGKDVGARAYFVKSEFDQAKLLDAVRRLLG